LYYFYKVTLKNEWMVHEKFMERCILLAGMGAGTVAPNPMAGCVIVHQGKIVGEGFHREWGGPHAEVLAIDAVRNPEVLSQSILYVSLEPCAHFGKTPPCSDLIIKVKIPQVVIGCMDPFPAVAGKGIEKLMNAGIVVKTGVLENECIELNRRFFTFHQKKRPYIFLKWAQTADGFMDKVRPVTGKGSPAKITNSLASMLVHKHRACESAIMVGTNTAILDNPFLTVRNWSGKNPLRIVIDQYLKLPESLHLFDNTVRTMVFTSISHADSENIRYETINFKGNILLQMMDRFYNNDIQSLIVEGGAGTLGYFIGQNLWDEAYIYTAPVFFSKGIRAPVILGHTIAVEMLDDNYLTVLKNG
jgi:diaminohydroxyphosphoribosylaminopyrimidine deaminase / 5-amino-6-(5-phosphoribosylamino)uracil reductase